MTTCVRRWIGPLESATTNPRHFASPVPFGHSGNWRAALRGQHWLQTVLTHADTAPSQALMRACSGAGTLAWASGDDDEAVGGTGGLDRHAASTTGRKRLCPEQPGRVALRPPVSTQRQRRSTHEPRNSPGVRAHVAPTAWPFTYGRDPFPPWRAGPGRPVLRGSLGHLPRCGRPVASERPCTGSQ